MMNSYRRRLPGCRAVILVTLLALAHAAAGQSKMEPPTTRPDKVGLSAERLQRIHEAIQRHIDAHRISGAVTLVARNGRVAHFEAHGLMDVETNKPMRRDALFALASMTKPVTGVAVLMLMEEGKVHLNDPVSKFIPEYKAMQVAVAKEGDSEIRLVPAEREITIRDLLTHTSGFSMDGPGTRQAPKELRWPIAPDETLARYVPRLAAIPLDFQPGTRWSYSPQVGIDTLARVVEVASGQSYDAFLRQRIFDPLGMKDTFFIPPADRRERQATIYQVSDKGLEKQGITRIPLPETYFSGAIGLVSTAEDYFRFAQMLLDGGRGNGKQLLSPRAVELYSSNFVGEMFGGQLGRPQGMGFGLTVEVVEDSVRAGTFRTNGSFGWDGSFGTYFWVDPKEKLVALLMVQTSTSVIGGIKHDFETAVMQAIAK
jgi:CubicO group peptidase (beta-lactamase class C family)